MYNSLLNRHIECSSPTSVSPESLDNTVTGVSWVVVFSAVGWKRRSESPSGSSRTLFSSLRCLGRYLVWFYGSGKSQDFLYR